MNTGRIVNEKLFGKTELKSEKVELALMDDIKQRHKALSQDTNRIASLTSEFFKNYNELIKIQMATTKQKRQITNMLNLVSETALVQQKEIASAESSLKELGMDNKILFQYKKMVDESLFKIKDVKNKI